MTVRRIARFAPWTLLTALLLTGCGVFGDDDQAASEEALPEVVRVVRVESGDRWFDIDPFDIQLIENGRPTQANIDQLNREVENLSLSLTPPTDAGVVHDGATFVVEPAVQGQTPDLEALALNIVEASETGIDTVQVPFSGVPADLTDEAAAAYAAELNGRLADGINVAIAGETGVLSNDLLGPATTVSFSGGRWDASIDFEQLDAVLARMFPNVGQPGGEATITIEESDDPEEPGTVVIVPGTPQTVCCDAESARRIEQALTSDVEVATLLFSEEDGERGTAWAEELGIQERVSTFTTNYTAGQSRVTNIRLIAELSQGVILMPGEAFSLNEHVGQRTREKGFVPAGTIVNGHLVDSVGGGISQFATTLFNAAFFGGLEFDAYQAHSIYFSRYPYGREATISWPAPALIISNPSPYPVLIWPTSTETSVTVDLYSTPWVEVEQTGQFESRVGAACTRVVTERTRTFIDDDSTDVDTVFATYRPEGIACDGTATDDPDAEQIEALENGEDPGFDDGNPADEVDGDEGDGEGDGAGEGPDGDQNPDDGQDPGDSEDPGDGQDPGDGENADPGDNGDGQDPAPGDGGDASDPPDGQDGDGASADDPPPTDDSGPAETPEPPPATEPEDPPTEGGGTATDDPAA